MAEDDGSIKFKVSLDETNLRKDAQQANNDFQTIIDTAQRTGFGIKTSLDKARQSVNSLSEEIIKQKSIIRETQNDVSVLSEKYNSLGKSNYQSGALLSQLNAAKSALGEQKYALGDLQSEQAKARLSVKKLEDQYRTLGVNAGLSINSIGHKIMNLGAIGIASVSITDFLDKIVSVRGELEQMQTVFEAIAGEEKGGKLFQDIKNWSFSTPMQINDVANAGKTMLAFGTDTDKVMPTLKMIGDIAAGNSQHFQSLTLAYSQCTAAGKLMGRDLLMMVNAGFNPLVQMSERTGKSMVELRKEMAAGAITAADVEQSFKDATSQGGKFYGMMDKTSKTINGSISNLKDAVTRSFDEIGTSNEGLITKGISTARYLVDNYATLGRVIAGLIATYGTYKAAVMMVSVAEQLNYQITMAHMASQSTLAGVTEFLTQKTKILNLTMLSNPYVLAATAIAALTAAMVIGMKETNSTKEATEAYQSAVERATQAEQEHKEKIDNLISVAQDEQSSTDDRRKALVRLETAYPGIFKKYKTEEDMLANILKIKQQIAAEDNIRSGKKAVEDIKNIDKRIAYAKKEIKNASQTQTGLPGAGNVNQALITGLTKQVNILTKQRGMMQKALSERQRERVMSGLGQYSTTRLENEIAVRNRLIKKIQNSQKLGGSLRSGQIANGVSPGIKSLNELEEESQAMKRIVNSRKSGSNTYRSDSEKAWKNWKNATKYYERLKNSATATTQQVQDAMKNVESASSSYKTITGITPEGLTKKDTAASKKAESARKRKEREAQRVHDKAAQQFNAEQQAEKLRQQSAQTKQEMAQEEVNIQKNTVDIMQDGLQKELAQIDLNYNKSIEEIQKKRNDWVNELQKTMDIQFEKAHPNWKKQNLPHPIATYNDLSDQQKSILSTETTQAGTAKTVGTSNVYNNLLTQYANYEQQRENIHKKYAKDRANLNTATDENGNKLTSKALSDYQQELNRKENDAIKQVNDAEISQVEKDNNLFVKLFGDTSQESVAEIQKIIDKVRELLDYLQAPKDLNGNGIINAKKGTIISKDTITKDTGLSGSAIDDLTKDPQKLAAIQKQLDQLLKTFQEEAPFEAFSANISKAIEKIKSGGNLLDDKGKDTGISNISEGIKEIGTSIDAVTPSVNKLGNSLSQIFDKGSSKGGRMADQVNTVVGILGSVGSAAKGVGEIMSGDVIDGVADTINSVGNLFSMANKAAERHKEALKAIMNEEIAQQREYNQLLIEQNLEYEKGTTAFGTDAYGKASNAVTEYGQITKELQTAQDKLSNVSIISGHKKTGLFGWGAGKDVYSSLLSQYPELINSAGEFNDELAESIINTRKMSDEDKATLQNAIDLYKDQKDALTQMRDYLSSIFGELGNTITDVLVSSFQHGTDAATKMTDSISDMLSKLAEQMVLDIEFEPAIESAQKALEKIMENTGLSDTDKFAQETAVLKTLFGSISSNEKTGMDLMTEFKNIGAQYGFDLFSNDSRSATTSSAISASQDSVDELAGRATAIQEFTKKSSDSLILLVSASNQALNHLAGIDKNTASIDGRINDMQTDITTMRKGIEKINDYGIDLKK